LKQNKLKQEIEEQKDTFEKLYLESSDGVLLLEDGKLIDCNDAVVNILKYKNKEQLLNIHISELSPKYQPDGSLSFDKAEKLLHDTLKNKFNRFEWLHKKSNSEEFWVEVVLTSITLKSKEIIHVLWREINNRKELEKQSKLLESQSNLANIGRLMSMIAHQWRQPLSLINSITSDIYHSTSNKEVLQIEDITYDLSQTITNIHKFYANTDNTQGKELRLIIDECINILFPIVAQSLKPKITINEIYNLKLTGYSSGLQQTIITILSNSIDIFQKRNILKPTISITLYKENEFSCIDIEDNGGGVDNKNINNIFDIHFSTNKNNSLRGLGLSIAKDIIENNLNGNISVVNTNSGAKFMIRYK